MDKESFYRNITSTVRTPRFAVLIDKNEKHWKACVNGIIQSFSQTWGGEHFIIIPTDGKTIDEVFWNVLEAYDPDKIGRYIPSLLDMEEADPVAYAGVKDKYRIAWQLPEDEFEQHWAKSLESGGNMGGLDIDTTLQRELKNRLSPFYFEDHVVSENVFHSSPLGFPFTEIEDIVESAKDKPTEVVKPMDLEDVDYRLLALSRAGALSENYADKLKAKGLTVTQLPSTKSFRPRDYLIALESGEYDARWQRAFGALEESDNNNDSDYPQEDFIKLLPFQLNMLHLGKFYHRDVHREEKENLLVVVGDTIADYCLYYCLSRMHDGVHWLPDKHLHAAHKKHDSNKKREDGDAIVKYTQEEDIASALITEYFKIISYGHNQKSIDIVSYTLTPRQLIYRKRWMVDIYFMSPTDFQSKSRIITLDELPLDCVMLRIENNNHANQQDMVFQNGHSVGRVNTPKPKNFSPVNAADHRWVTDLTVDNFRPPALPFLGSQIIELRSMSYETRIAQHTLAYLCPNIGYFGGDIDVTTVRPGLNLLSDEEMFSAYFGDSGYTTELSDKGSYLKDTISRFGSLEQTASFFRSQAKRNLFDQYLFTAKQKDSEVIYLDVEHRAYLSFKAFERKLSGEEEAVLLIDKLIEKNIISRGLIFQCSRCRLAAWYDVAAVGSTFSCSRCGLVQSYSHINWKSPAEPSWYYRLAETVYLFYESSSHVTALALDKLRQESPDTFHYISETNIINPLSKKKQQEIDVLAIANGKIILGECKNCPVESSDVRKYLTIFSQLNIQPFQFLLATTETGISDAVQAELNKFKHSRLLTRQDLYGLIPALNLSL